MEKYIGKVLNDQYMITEVIGVGGMSYVFKAFDKICNRVVAVKILKDEFMSDAQFRRRFTNESKAITMLSHSNIVDVHDVCLEGDILYIVMEYIDGITLKEYIEKKGVLSVKETIHFARQILKGLSHAHERGIVHRDIKPHNIILLKDGTIKITDFGIAHLTKFDTQTISDMTIGSVHYISPEQASGDHTDERSDIYSVGIMLYEMLTGRLPFEADTPIAVAMKQVNDQPDLPTEVNAEIPQGMEDIILKAMMKDPAVRYRSVGSILADLTLFESDPTITFNYAAEAEPQEDPMDTDNSPTIFAENLLGNLNENEEDTEDGNEEGEPDSEEEEEGEETASSKNFKTTWLPILAGIGTAFFLLVLVAVGFIFQKELFGPKTVTCPGVVGSTVEQAKKSNNFQFVIESTVPSDTHPAGVIITQSPQAGAQIKKKGKITVVVSSGPSSTDINNNNNNSDLPSGENYVPNVIGWTKEDAMEEFSRQKISFRFISDFDDNAPEGTVISTDPSAGVEIFKDTIVEVVISRGPKDPVVEEPDKIETVEMPNLLDEKEDNLERVLKNNKLTLGEKEFEYSDTVEKGRVISQSVKEGTKVEAGTKVNFVISKGPKEPATEEPPAEETTKKYEVTATIPTGDGAPKAGDTVQLTLSVNGVEETWSITVEEGKTTYTKTVECEKNPTISVKFNGEEIGSYKEVE